MKMDLFLNVFFLVFVCQIGLVGVDRICANQDAHTHLKDSHVKDTWKQFEKEKVDWQDDTQRVHR